MRTFNYSAIREQKWDSDIGTAMVKRNCTRLKPNWANRLKIIQR